MSALSNYLAFWLRFDGEIPEKYLHIMLDALLLLVALRALFFTLFRLHQGLWKYTGIWDLKNIVVASLLSSLTFFILVHLLMGEIRYPRSIYIMDTILLICMLVGIRLPRRILREMRFLPKGKRLLIYGAGDAGEMIVRDIKKNPSHQYWPVCFIDDDFLKAGQDIHGIPILGTRKDLPSIIEREKVDEILIAIPSAGLRVMRDILKTLEPFKIPIKTLPNLRDILDGRVDVTHIRSLAIEDLLPRAPVDLDPTPVKGFIEGKRILVTGAGGSIGAEICRQLAGFHPLEIILFDRYENGLYKIENELVQRQFTGGKVVVGDVTDARRVNSVLRRHGPDIIFHAAAHKHVPLMEANPCEAIKNNVTGTRILIEGAHEYGVKKFILISTDKAVNPYSIMGATKRLCELMMLSFNNNNNGNQCFSAVRFGNVLASNGSVVPLFLEQIENGGPVTVTDPEMRRYFMLIPEAVQLVFHAATLENGAGRIQVLDMGEQIHVLDMARNLIRLSGHIPDEEIPIVFTGLRPGEKLYEELVGKDEIMVSSPVKGIFQVQLRESCAELSREDVLELEELASQMEVEETVVIDCLRRLVPTFRPFHRESPAETESAIYSGETIRFLDPA